MLDGHVSVRQDTRHSQQDCRRAGWSGAVGARPATILGLYATVEQPGEISPGDQVELLDDAAVRPA